MKTGAALLMLIPAGFCFLLSFAVPLVMVGRLSFYTGTYVAQSFTGLTNYVAALQDEYFLKSFVNAGIFTALIVPAAVFFSYRIASLLSDFGARIQNAGRFLLYLPALTAGLVMALLWGWFLHRQGVINGFLGMAGIAAIPWLAEAWSARVAISAITIMGQLGGYVIIFSASMCSLSRDLQDAAKIDGATQRQYKRHIVFPLMMPTITLALVLGIVGIMQMWETMYVLTEHGGPEGSTASPVYEIFLTAFNYGRPGLAAAKGIMLMAVIGAILWAKTRVERWIAQ